MSTEDFTVLLLHLTSGTLAKLDPLHLSILLSQCLNTQLRLRRLSEALNSPLLAVKDVVVVL